MTETIETVSEATYRERAGAMANMLEKNPYRHLQAVWGTAKEENPCGTVGCVAGWSLLALRGIVTITPDGEMTYDEADLGPISEGRNAIYYYSRQELTVPTLWRDKYADDAMEDGAQWLGLSENAAYTLFRQTVGVSASNAVAVELLRRLSTGALDRDFRMDEDDLWELVKELTRRQDREVVPPGITTNDTEDTEVSE